MSAKDQQELASAVIRFAGDSGDGMQLTGNQFTDTSAISGNDITTFPDFPAEIRAPAGTTAGVSGFQLNFSSSHIETPGDMPDALVAMNPAALKANIADLKKGGVLVVNSDSFGKNDLKKAKYDETPLAEGAAIFEHYDVHQIPMTSLVVTALDDLDMKPVQKKRCKNFFALGLMYWLYDRSLDFTLGWIEKKFKGKEILIEANVRALKAGYNYGDITEAFTHRFHIPGAHRPAGSYRQITGNSALAYGLTAATHNAKLGMTLGTYPITPASDILHELAKLKNFNVKTVQAEDEIAAIGVAVGASFAGDLGVTTTSGPGICLKSEFMGLAAVTELPVIIVNVQRGGPSTGLPTKTEQSDLLQAMSCRNGDSPLPIIAPKSPVDCFHAAYDAVKMATEFMTPVILLSDGYLANGSDLWHIPDASELSSIKPNFYEGEGHEEDFNIFKRDEETMARQWVKPGTPGMQHLLTGLEKDETGSISYDGKNHALQSQNRLKKLAAIAKSYKPTGIYGEDKGKALVISWGGTYGSTFSAVKKMREEGQKISHIHLRNVYPFPNDLGAIIERFDNIIVPELNMGQLVKMIRAEYCVDAHSITKVEGKPFGIQELTERLTDFL